MTVLIGHPSGNPNSHNAAAAYFEAGMLEAFCVPWMPSLKTIGSLGAIPAVSPFASRFARRRFSALDSAPKLQGKTGEAFRLFMRGVGMGSEALSYQANDWLMRRMQHACRRSAVTVVHSYEDCSVLQFREAKTLNKVCVYDMPIGYYPAWEETQAALARKFVDWLPGGFLSSSRHVRPAQKRIEMELADLVLVPSKFVEGTVRRFFPEKRIALARYGVDQSFWTPRTWKRPDGPLRFICAGQMSIRKGLPDLLEAWRWANLIDARLELVGSWQLSPQKLKSLPDNVTWSGPCAREQLRERYRAADIFVLPSYFEGFPLAFLEALACGLPAIVSEAVADPEVLPGGIGRIVPIGNIEALIAGLRAFNLDRERLVQMSMAAHEHARSHSWEHYRENVRKAVRAFG
jgi:glycosyltransferase involved in cell wall biosynthesis